MLINVTVVKQKMEHYYSCMYKSEVWIHFEESQWDFFFDGKLEVGKIFFFFCILKEVTYAKKKLQWKQ